MTYAVKNMEYQNMLQKKPKVSIIACTCNRPQVLRLALLSVQAQTYSKIETVVIEDGKATAKI